MSIYLVDQAVMRQPGIYKLSRLTPRQFLALCKRHKDILRNHCAHMDTTEFLRYFTGLALEPILSAHPELNHGDFLLIAIPYYCDGHGIPEQSHFFSCDYETHEMANIPSDQQ